MSGIEYLFMSKTMSMKSFYSLVVFLTLAVFSFGQTNWTGAIDSDWNNAGNWTAGVPTTGVLTTVLASPNDPVISTGTTIDFTLQNFATITFEADVQNASTIANFGGATIFNNASFINNAGQFINNNGMIVNNLQLTNEGTIQSNGTGALENATTGTFDNAAGAAINNFATIINDGTFNNDGNIANCNTVDNSGDFNNNGPLNQGANGIFNNLNGGVLNNSSNITNSGEINNNIGGEIVNDNIVQNNSNGSISNDGLFINNDAVTNAGLFDNTGTFENNEIFTNDFGATFSNTSGDILNNSCATFRQFTSNPISCNSACSFINNGTVYQIGGAIDITGGTGVILDDINIQPSPIANCQDIIVVLDASGEAMIEALDVDNNSSAGYCTLASLDININTFTCDNIGANVVTLTITDGVGATGFCTAIVMVVDGTAPIFNNCPADMTINLDAGECNAYVNFNEPTANDICGTIVTKIDNTGLNSGDPFPIGTTTIEYQATDGSNISTCSFSITVQEFPNPETSLFCNFLEQISLDENCEALVGADDILEGGPYGCYDNYTIDIFYDIEMTQPVPTSPYVTGQDLDDTLVVMVTEPFIGNSCWGKIFIKDYLAPQITCENLTITCLEDSSPDALGYPATSDNCDNGLFPSFEDEETGGGCVDGIITRTWTITDASGNSNSCQQIITIVRPDFGLVVFPLDLNNLELPALDCSNNPNTHPDYTGWPTISGQNILNSTCNFSSTYTDQLIQVCEGSYDIVRSWEVWDWCTSTMMADIQIIKVMDNDGAALICPADIELSTGTNSCVASVILPEPIINDACANASITNITSSAGSISNGVLINLPVGTHTVTYTIEDACENESSCSINVIVTDEVAPVAICESTHTVGLTIDEPTLVPALVFDDGSYDNCSGLIYQVRRMDNSNCPGFDGTPFGQFVPFYCCDVGGPNVMIELRVTDVSGNSNSCMVEVVVEDKLNPAIQCPPDITLDCYDDYTDLSVTGEAIASDNCSYVLTHTDDVNIDNCGGGVVNRIWTATDPGGRTASCLQRVYVVNDAPFYITDTECNNANPSDGVIWPCDYETSNCAAVTDLSVTGQPQIIEDGCDLVSVTHEDIELPITEPACSKIIRVWTIHDWCQYDAVTGEGVWTYNQIIKILNTQAPEFTSDCEDQSFCSYEQDCGDAPVELLAAATDDCTDEADLNFNYEIDLNNDGSVDFSANGNDASGAYPLGTHKIKWFVEDGCGNVNTCDYLFVIADCKNPTPYCINGIAMTLMPNVNQIEIWANDFDLGSYDNCGVDEFLMVSPSQGPGQNLPPVSAGASHVFDCDDVGTQTVDMWVKDIFGNWDYCSTYIIIQDNANSCPAQDDVQVTGVIENESGARLESVMVHVEGSAPGIPDPNVTGIDGDYGFPNLPMGYNYMIQPEKTDNPLNGVSTFDLVLMNKHILGIQTLDSPYKMIAADINASSSISTFDMVLLRRLILQIDENFTSTNSWRFVDANYVFPNPTDPFGIAFPEVFEIDNLEQDMVGNFIAVKTGDVNGNAATNSFNGGGDDRNMEDPLVFTLKDELLNPGRAYQVDFTAADISRMSGYQFTLTFDKELLIFNNIIPGQLPGLTLSNFGFNKLGEGSLTTSWNQNADLSSLDEDAVLFSFIFEAKTQTKWSESLKISSEYTRAEAYNLNAEILNVVLGFESLIEDAKRFKLFPNTPNPFAEETLISFNLPEDSELIFTIQDVSGKVLQNQETQALEGYNEILISKKDLNGPGVYFYTIKTKTHRVSQKMILIKE